MKLHPATRAAQALHHIDNKTGGVSPALELSSTFARDGDYQPRQSYIYGRDGGSTVKLLEALVADLDEAPAALAFSSGMAAITTLFEILKAGDHLLLSRVMYHGTLNWARHLAENRGVTLDLFDPARPETLAEALTPQTRLVWLETPVNPTWDVLDIATAAAACRNVGARLAVDSTAAPPCTTQPLTLGADIVFHSATKYMGGHSDLVAGTLAFREPALAERLTGLRSLRGTIIAPFDAWLLIRGLRTLFLRFERASTNALTIAKHFDGHPKVAKVLYPGLPAHPGHEVAKAQMTGGFGGMLSLLMDSEETAARVVRTTRLWLPATSLGGVESLIEHRKPIEGPQSEVAPELLRLSTGIEDVGDLMEDLAQAIG
ncbi:trans-sulfuration enzyme family protein [Algicella marina]|uniref:Aminotransferase class V-fold PLP-dependent enzyme n=1 Tax=Algicella marina TaxID=2683284 RepID=A0A6P1SZN6_9RHOB|nr:aminotransferase class I/II-fold pyridoxal phosphate-dependent enzyme [Algicella marina]QHQ34985.1 aminotransferase class V-fold PLP-dependent enzyme [Algicella marina]